MEGTESLPGNVENTAASVIARNLVRIRKGLGLTQAELAERLAAEGLRWTRDQVAAFENPKRARDLTVCELVLLARAFRIWGVREHPVGELLAGGNAELAWFGDAVVTLKAARLALVGGEPGDAALSPAAGLDVFKSIGRRQLEEEPCGADRALALRLGVGLDDVTNIARAMWGRTLTQQRDVELGELGDLDVARRAAHRGHITRRLADEIGRRIDNKGERG